MVEVTDSYKNIIDAKPQFLTKITYITASKYLMLSSYAPLFLILSNGPLTIPDIVDKYNKFLKNNSTTDEKKTPKTAKENTIYKYLKQLIEVGLVIETGAQIDLSKTSTKTKTLYQLRSLYFVPENENFDNYSSDIGNLIAEIVGVFLSSNFNDKFPDPAKLKDVLASYSKNTYDKFYKFIESLENHIDNPVYQKAFQDLRSLHGKYYFKALSIFKLLIEMLELSKDGILTIEPFFSFPESSTLKDTTINLIDEVDYTTTVIPNEQFKQTLVMSVDEASWKKYFDGIVYASIFYLLRTKAMTVKQIHANLNLKMTDIYTQQCQMCITYGKEDFPEEPHEIKSESTVWRHIKELVDAGYLSEAGRLYSPESKTTQILYARSSKMYTLYNHDSDIFQSPEGEKVLQALAPYVMMYLQKSSYDFPAFKNTVIKLFDALNEALEHSYRELKHNSVIDVTRNLQGSEFDAVLSPISLAEFFIHSEDLNSEKLISDLRNCFM